MAVSFGRQKEWNHFSYTDIAKGHVVTKVSSESDNGFKMKDLYNVFKARE